MFWIRDRKTLQHYQMGKTFCTYPQIWQVLIYHSGNLAANKKENWNNLLNINIILYKKLLIKFNFLCTFNFHPFSEDTKYQFTEKNFFLCKKKQWQIFFTMRKTFNLFIWIYLYRILFCLLLLCMIGCNAPEVIL